MRARELKAHLNTLAEAELDRDVVIEGCDCCGEALDVKLEDWPWRKESEKNPEVLFITRDMSQW